MALTDQLIHFRRKLRVTTPQRQDIAEIFQEILTDQVQAQLEQLEH